MLLLGAGGKGVAAAAGGNPALILAQATGGGGGATTTTFTTAADIAVGETFLIAHNVTASRSVSSISDGLSNTYTTSSVNGAAPIPTTHRFHFSYCKVTTLIPSGTTITITYSGSASRTWVAASYSNIHATPLDLNGTLEVGTAETTCVQTSPGTPAQAVEMAIGLHWFEDGSSPITQTFTPDAAWTNVGTGTRATLGRLSMFSKLITNGVAPGATGTNSLARDWMGRMITLKGA